MANFLSAEEIGDAFRFVLELSAPAGAPEDASRLGDAAAAFLNRRGAGAERVFACRMVLEELITNLGKYGAGDDGGKKRLTCRGKITTDDAGFHLVFADNGVAFDVASAPLPNVEAELSAREPGGLGLFMLRRMFQSVRHARGRDWNLSMWTYSSPADGEKTTSKQH